MFKKIFKRVKKIFQGKNKEQKNYEKEIEQERNRIVSILNHDIKSPILAQIQALNLLLQSSFGELSTVQKEIINNILTSNNFLLEVISNAIFLINYENEKPELKLENVNIIEQIEDCCRILKSFANDKKQNIIIKADKSPDIKLSADRKLIHKIIFNLLSSSVSFGLENTDIEILIKENKKSVSFFAKNKSVYMSKEKINSLLEDRKNQRDFNQLGMNLNLNIANKLINAHNWNIIAKSQKNNSSIFGFVVKK